MADEPQKEPLTLEEERAYLEQLGEIDCSGCPVCQSMLVHTLVHAAIANSSHPMEGQPEHVRALDLELALRSSFMAGMKLALYNPVLAGELRDLQFDWMRTTFPQLPSREVMLDIEERSVLALVRNWTREKVLRNRQSKADLN